MSDDPNFAPMTAEEEQLRKRYHDAAHRTQSAVAFKLEAGYEHSATVKHMRVGVNSTMVDSGALAQLLIRTGVISRRDYLEAIAVGMEREAEVHQNEARKRSGIAGLNFL